MATKKSYPELLARIEELEQALREQGRIGDAAQPVTGAPSAFIDPRKTKEELLDQLRLVRTLFDTIPNPVFYKNKEGAYLGCNRSFAAQILGLPPERIIGRSLYDLPIPRLQADIYHRKDLELLHNPGQQVYESQVHCADGVVRDFMFYKATHTDHSGAVAGIIGVMLDVTERNRMQLALKENEEKYRSMMEAMIDAVYICSPEFTISYMNPKMIEKVGYDATGLKCHSVLHNLSEPCAWCTFEKVRAGETTEVEVFSPKDGHRYLVANSPILHQNGSVSKMTIYHDVTQRKKIEEELLLAKKLEATGVFAGGVAHDYNNLLFTILGNLLILKKDVPAASEHYKLVLAAEEAALKATRLTKRLLIFTHGEPFALEGYAVDILLQDVIRGMEIPGGYTVELQLPAKRLQKIYVDASLISIVMINIITNAIEAMEGGGTVVVAAADVRLEADSEPVATAMVEYPGDYVRITVADTGVGIDKEALPKIFDPYFSTKRRGAKKGLGFGLSTSYSIIRKHSGAILVESEKGRGTTVSLYLPAYHAAISHSSRM